MPICARFQQYIKLFFDRHLQARLIRIDDIEMILDKLGSKELSLLQAISGADNADELAGLQRDLAIVRAQQQKGRAVVKRLAGTDDGKPSTD